MTLAIPHEKGVGGMWRVCGGYVEGMWKVCGGYMEGIFS